MNKRLLLIMQLNKMRIIPSSYCYYYSLICLFVVVVSDQSEVVEGEGETESKVPPTEEKEGEQEEEEEKETPQFTLDEYKAMQDKV